jgi:hypothetical protein
MSYTNSDGLYVLSNGGEGVAVDNGGSLNSVKYLVVDIPDATELGTSATAPTPLDAYIPAGSYITKASLVVTTAWTSGGSGTLGIGLQNSAGSAIDADGIDAAIAKTALAVNTAVACDGALVGGTATVGAADAYISLVYATAAFTAGAGKLVIEYITV